MATRPNPELIDEENPEWTDGDFKRAVPFSALPADLQAILGGRVQNRLKFTHAKGPTPKTYNLEELKRMRSHTG